MFPGSKVFLAPETNVSRVHELGLQAGFTRPVHTKEDTHRGAAAGPQIDASEKACFQYPFRRQWSQVHRRRAIPSPVDEEGRPAADDDPPGGEARCPRKPVRPGGAAP